MLFLVRRYIPVATYLFYAANILLCTIARLVANDIVFDTEG